MNSVLRGYFHYSVTHLSNKQAGTSVLPSLAVVAFAASLFFLGPGAFGQGLGTSGTIRGRVTDPSGAVVRGAAISLLNDLTLYREAAVTDENGEFQFVNIPPNVYHLEVQAPGFERHHEHVLVRTTVPLNLAISLAVASERTSITVSSEPVLIETTPTAHSDLNRAVFSKMPAFSIAAGASDMITLSTPAVVADSNGFFHALGDHAQMAFSVDNQPITDQQGNIFSTQIPLNAIQSMEAVYGGTPAEYGDKTALVVTAVTRSGLGQQTHGSFSAEYGSFGTINQRADIGFGKAKWGNFFAENVSRSGRFLDSPEFLPFHDLGNNQNVFDRFDYQPRPQDSLHLNILAARSWFQIPNTYDQQDSGQDQHQMVRSYNVAPGWIHVFGPSATLTVNPFLRQDLINYFPSADLTADQPGTVSQTRRLTNLGLKMDVNYHQGRHTAKVGVQVMHTLLSERFSLGLTDPTFNPVCVDSNGEAVLAPGVTDPGSCAAAGFEANPDVSPGLVPYDLTRGGTLFQFRGHADIKEQAFYAQDLITVGKLTLNPGLRFDRYDGLSYGTQWEPRLGLSYLVSRTSTVLRLAYSHLYETPLNENLVLSSATGAGGLAANVFGAYDSVPLRPGIRNMSNAGFQQGIGTHFVLDADYFWKYTRNAYDLDNLFNTAIYFPIEWYKSKMDGVSARLTLRQYKGISAFTTLGHARARVFGPEIGGLIFGSPVDRSVVRIDHDQALQQTTHIQYQLPRNGPWIAFTWRYDSGIISGAVPDLASILGLTGDQQAQIGFYCGDQVATPWGRITTCDSSDWGAKLVRIPAPGTANDDTNPARVRPRHLFNLGVGTDNLFRTDKVRWTLRLTALNMTDKVSLYNFLSTCAGTHFVPPRSYRAELGIAF